MASSLLSPLLIAGCLLIPPSLARGETPTPGMATGHVADGHGHPLAGAVVYLERLALAGPPLRGKTDADGRYAIKLPALPLIYRAHAWLPLTYRGKVYCLRIAPDAETDRQSIGSRDGGVRQFRWKISGPVDPGGPSPESDSAYYGGTLRLMPSFEDGDYTSVIELQLTPDGPLIDGSTGEVLRRRVDLSKSPFVYDIPIGVYRVTATRTRADGARGPVRLGPGSTTADDVAVLEFKPQQTILPCGSAADDNGIDRAFLSVVAP